MKQRFLFMLMLSGLIALFGATQTFAVSVVLTPSDSFITVGETFTVDLEVTAPFDYGDLAAFGFFVDPDLTLSLISYTGYTLSPDYFDVSMFAPDHLEGLYAGSGNAGDPVLLATLGFKALSSGDEMLTVEGLFGIIDYSGLYYSAMDFDPNTGDPILVDTNVDLFSQLPITIHAAPVPEPATMLLLGTGLIGMGAAGRRKFRK